MQLAGGWTEPAPSLRGWLASLDHLYGVGGAKQPQVVGGVYLASPPPSPQPSQGVGEVQMIPEGGRSLDNPPESGQSPNDLPAGEQVQ